MILCKYYDYYICKYRSSFVEIMLSFAIYHLRASASNYWHIYGLDFTWRRGPGLWISWEPRMRGWSASSNWIYVNRFRVPRWARWSPANVWIFGAKFFVYVFICFWLFVLSVSMIFLIAYIVLIWWKYLDYAYHCTCLSSTNMLKMKLDRKCCYVKISQND